MLVSSPDADWSLFEDPDEPTCGQRSASYGTLAESPGVLPHLVKELPILKRSFQAGAGI